MTCRDDDWGWLVRRVQAIAKSGAGPNQADLWARGSTAPTHVSIQKLDDVAKLHTVPN